MCEQTSVTSVCVFGGAVLRSCLNIVVQQGDGQRKVLEKYIGIRESSVRRKGFTEYGDP